MRGDEGWYAMYRTAISLPKRRVDLKDAFRNVVVDMYGEEYFNSLKSDPEENLKRLYFKDLSADERHFLTALLRIAEIEMPLSEVFYRDYLLSLLEKGLIEMRKMGNDTSKVAIFLSYKVKPGFVGVRME